MPGLTKLFLLSKEVKKGVLALLMYFICTFSCATSSLLITECRPIIWTLSFRYGTSAVFWYFSIIVKILLLPTNVLLIYRRLKIANRVYHNS